MKPKILVDIDGVLANFVDGVRKKFVEHGVDPKAPAHIENFKFEEWIPASKETIGDVMCDFITGHGYVNLDPYPYVKEFLDSLKDHYEVRIVTARNSFPGYDNIMELAGKIQEDTKEWLDKNDFHYDTLEYHHDKEVYCINNDIGILVEDKNSTVEKAADLGIKCYLVKHSWNADTKDHPNIIKVDSLKEIMEDMKLG